MRLVRLLCLAVLVVSSLSCGDARARREAACDRAVRDLITGLQSYVDDFAGMTPERFARLETQPPRSEVQVALVRYRAQIRRNSCDPAHLGRRLSVRAATLRGSGIIAETIATTLRATLLRLGGDQSPQVETRRVSPGTDIASAVASVVPGSQLVLEAGVHRITRTLVVLESVTLSGEGKDKTRIVSSAPGAAIIFLGDGALKIEQMSITHTGSQGASLIVLRSGSYTISRTRVANARQGAGGVGGIGLVVGLSSETPRNAPPRVMRITDSEFVNNAASGITIGGRDAPTIDRTTVTGSRACGVCFVGASSGVLRDSRIASNRIGVTAWSTARPTIVTTNIARNNIGLHVRDSGAPTITRNTFATNRSADIVFSGRSTGRASGNSCATSRPTIVLLENARPTVSGNRCATLDNRRR